MKHIIYAVMLLLGLSILNSCEKEPVLSISPSSLTFDNTGGSQTIAITTNRQWSASSSEEWCRVSPASGTVDDNTNVSVTITCDANDTYDDRSCTVTIKTETLTTTVNVSQGANYGLIVSKTDYAISNDAQEVEVGLRANVKFEVVVEDACKDWIRYDKTKGLTSSTVVLSVSKNDSYDGRDGKVTIKEVGGSRSSVVTIKQSQANGLFVTNPEYSLPAEQQKLTVEIKSNIDFEVRSEASWIKHVGTKGLKTSQITLDVAANNTYDTRKGIVVVRQKNGNLCDTIFIVQAENIGIVITQADYKLDCEQQVIDVEVKSNVEYSIAISDDCSDWISMVETKGLTANKCKFSIAKNEALEERKGSITFKQKEGNLSKTVSITQYQTKVIDLGLSVKWATYNVGAIRPEEKGNLFQWAGTEAKWVSGGPYYNVGYTKYTSKANYVLEPMDDAASAIWGGEWRMPTYEEWKELLEGCTWTWTDSYRGKGIAGMIVSSNVEGYEGKSIFLPSVGYQDDSRRIENEKEGYYWSSSLKITNYYPFYAAGLIFTSNGANTSIDINRRYGCSVRPVCE